jgi:F-type H+-transporting ATPase subunit delta
MPRKFNARRYARAVYEIALETRTLESWQADLRKIAGVISNAEFLAAMESPKIRFDKKSQLLAARLDGVSPLGLNLARLLVVKNGIGMISEIAAEYERLVDAYHGIRKAQVVTAVPIDDRDREKLAENIGALIDSKVIVESEVDPGILGGVVAHVGGKLLDGSTRTRLAALKRALEGSGGKG